MNLGNFRILLLPFRTSLCIGILNSTIFNIFNNQNFFGMILEELRTFRGFEHPKSPLALPPI